MRIGLFVLLAATLLPAQELVWRGLDQASFVYGERGELRLVLVGGSEKARLGALPALADLEIEAAVAETDPEGPSWRIVVAARRPGRIGLRDLTVDDGSALLKAPPLDLDFALLPAAADRMTVALEVDRDRIFSGATIVLRLLVRCEAEFAARNLLQPFGRELDLPVLVVAPRLDGDEVLERIAVPESGGASLVLNGELVRAELLPGGEREPRVYRLERRFRVRRAEAIAIPPPILRFEFATRFADDFLAGRRPLDRQRGRVYGPELRLEPLELPPPSGPSPFTGAIGRFTIASRTAASEVEQGEIFALDVVIRGEGNLDGIAAPGFELPGFHVYGSRELPAPEPESRLFRYEIAALAADLGEIPAVELLHFDPELDRYELAASAPIPLRVRPRVDFAPPPAIRSGPRPGIDDIHGLHPGGPRAGDPRIDARTFWFALVLPLVAAFAALVLVEARDRDRRDPLGARARRARRRFLRGLGRESLPRHELLAEYLGARLRRPAPSLFVSDLEGLLVAGGIPAELAARAADLQGRLVASRYGGADESPGDDELRALVEEVERSLDEEGGR